MYPKKIAIVMGSRSDYPIMQECSVILTELNVQHESMVVSAHRTPKRLYDFAQSLSESEFCAVIAGAGGAAHLPGMIASLTTVPVLGVPIVGKTNLSGWDSLLSIVQMPAGVPVATFAVGKAGAINSAIYAASILASYDQDVKSKLEEWRKKQTESVPLNPID